MAGKKGRCKACQHILTVPKLAASSAPGVETVKPEAPTAAEPKTPAPPRAAADVEAEAASLFTDETKPAGPVEVKLIDLNCPYCDEPIQLPLDLAGKRAPCPECKHIIKVPEPVKKDPKDWRKVETRGPSGARMPEQPELDGAWGSTTARGVARDTLVKAGVIPEEQRTRTRWQKVRLPVLVTSLVLVLSIGGWMGYRWWAHRAADRALAEALAFADSPEATPLAKAALATGAGDYSLHSRGNRPGAEANIQLGKALTALRPASKGDERDGLLTDLALALIELGGDKPETDQELRMPWDDIQKRLFATLGAISDAEARLQALRAVAHRLVERGQTARVLPLTNQVYPRTDPEKTADQAAALTVVGLELLKLKDRESAEKAVKEALSLYEGKKKPPLRAPVVALALILGLDKQAPTAGEAKDDKANEYLGKVAALARQGEWDKARDRVRVDEFDKVVRFRAQLAIAAAAVDDKVPNTTDLEAAFKMAEDGLIHKAELSWSLYRLIRLALATSFPQDRVQALADNIGNSAVRGRAQLAIFRARLAQQKQPAEDSAADKIEANSLARSLAAQALARHNTRLGVNYAGVVQAWPQPIKSFGALGIALGLQDRDK
ncbi:MAG TPA: hypothetical protein VMG10_03020 [Gemmataceae bacterium]|nr:hypothetical protein [Gemmataceae bacterium]